jgi:hypothetical protein
MVDPRHQTLVKIQPAQVRELATSILRQSQDGTRPSIEWDEEQWHYRPSLSLPSSIARERLALYILAMDAINFCFWPSHVDKGTTAGSFTNFEYEHLARAMASMAHQDEDQQLHANSLNPDYVFSPSRLARLTPSEMADLWNRHLTRLADEMRISPITPLDDIETRCKLWNEIGRVLLMDPWNGSVLNFLHHSSSDTTVSPELLTAPQLVDRIVESFAGFRDISPWEASSSMDCHAKDAGAAKSLYLLKRAQICVGDLNASLRLQLGQISHITTFADYRVPQLLRHLQILQYEHTLACSIDEGKELPRNSPEEKTIRAATVVAVEAIVDELKHQQRNGLASDSHHQEEYMAMTVDWYLWQIGERMHKAGVLKPHHRTRTIFY